jgi:autotransporter-associated beta strand protein
MADGSGTDSAAGETAIFNITTLNAAVTTTLNANLTMGCFVFNNTGTTQIHTDNVASRIITLGAGGITINPRAGSVQFAETNATNKKVQFVLTACQSWINNGSGTLSLTSDAAPNINVGAYRLVFGGSGNIATMGRFAGTGGYTKTGAGILTATSVSSFTGSLILEGGTWDATTFANVNTDSSIGKGSVSGSAADLVFGGGTLRHSAANVASTNRLFTIGNATGLTATIDSSAVSATNTTSFTGTDALAYGGSGARTLTLKGSNTGTNTFAPVIGDGTGGATSLVKDGTGAWTVSGASNSYTGATTILDGTLSVTAPNFADASTVTIGTSAGSPAVLNLPNAGTDNVAVLIIDGVTKAAGLYDKDNSDGAITGDGKINVGAVVPDYDTWKTANSVTGGPTADDDGDGLRNFDEYAYGLNPKSGASANPISSPLNKTTGLFKYTRRKQSLTGLAYTYESSTTLAGAWPTFTPDSANSNGGDPVEEITVDVPNALLANPALFIRVKAVQP